MHIDLLLVGRSNWLDASDPFCRLAGKLVEESFPREHNCLHKLFKSICLRRVRLLYNMFGCNLSIQKNGDQSIWPGDDKMYIQSG